MTAYLDRRLTNQITTAGDYRPVEAVIVVKESESLLLSDNTVLARRAIDAAVERTGDQPTTVR